MTEAYEWCSGAFRLELQREQLWRGTEAVRLRPKSFAVLRYLVEHPDRVVTKDELLQAVWPDTAVSEGVLTVCLNELRQALQETARAPQCIATVHRRGYRFVAPITRVALLASPLPPAPDLSPISSAPAPILVGRQADVAQVHAWLAQARQGVRQVGFVTGEAGLGKTTVVDAFVAQVRHDPGLWLSRGQCLEHYGAGEAYLPVLEALGQLCRGPDGARLVAALSQYAPTWLMQMPGLLTAEALEAVQRRVQGAIRERMLREFAEAVEALTVERPLVLVLEDLHWSDAATLDLVGALARRRAPACLLVLGTYRPVEVIVHAHPLHALKLDLTLHQQCVELPLQLLTAAAVAQYLAARFGVGGCPPALIQVLHRRTDGHPLFLVMVVEALVQQGLVRRVDGQWVVTEDLGAVEGVIPESLRQLIAQQFDRLSPAAQDVLAMASVAGMESSVAALVAGIEATEEAVETTCAGLAQHGQFLRAHGTEEWPDGTVTARYGFRHTLYQQVIYDRLPVAQRLRLHRQIGRRLEVGHGAQARTRAAELAMHFDRGRDTPRAVTYLQQAAANARQRWAYAEALEHLQRGLTLLQSLPDTRERGQQELTFHLTLGQTWSVTRGLAAPEVGEAYTRAQTLCAQVGDVAQRLSVLRGLRRFHLARADLQMAQVLSAQCLSLAERLADPGLLAEAHAAMGSVAYYQGALATAQMQLTQGLRYATTPSQHIHMAQYGQDPTSICLTLGALTRWLRGSPDAALPLMQQALDRAPALAQPFGMATVLHHSTVLHLLRGDIRTVQEQTDTFIALASAYGLDMLGMQATLLQGWVLAVQGQPDAGLPLMQQALMAIQVTEQKVGQLMYVALLAEQYGQAGQVDAGLQVLTEALASLKIQEPLLWEPELYRVRGTLLLQAGGLTSDTSRRATDAEAETCFQQAIALARR
jgi:DNA-binding winged helix-turn-helix (wHTH) protein/tetratricopeptide (TPR) repeat protein